MTTTPNHITAAGTVQHLNPETLHHNPAFSQAVAVTGAVKTVYIGGQNAVDAAGTIVGQGDIGAQTEQVMQNLQAALKAGGASLEHVIATVALATGARARRSGHFLARNSS